jgi:hypothetical protein
MIETLDLLAHPQSSSPYVQMGMIAIENVCAMSVGSELKCTTSVDLKGFFVNPVRTEGQHAYHHHRMSNWLVPQAVED